MEYLDPKEIKESSEVKERLSKWVSPTIRTGFSEYLVNKYITKNSFSLLDAGTASGEFAKVVKKVKPQAKVYGVDIEDYRKDTEGGFDGFFEVDLNISRLPFEDNTMDYVTAWCLIPHLENPYNFTREASRVLRPEGLFMFSVINVVSHGHRRYFYRYGELPGFHDRNNHITILTPAVLKKTVFKYFDVVGCEYLLSPSIFSGFWGQIRGVMHKLLPDWTRQRWGAKVFYILRKKIL